MGFISGQGEAPKVNMYVNSSDQLLSYQMCGEVVQFIFAINEHTLWRHSDSALRLVFVKCV